MCKGEGEDQADDDEHQDKRSRHCHTQEQTFLTRKRRWNIQEGEKMVKSAKPDQIPEQGEPDRSDQRGKGASWLGQPGKVPP